MSKPKRPVGLATRGKRLWREITEAHDLDSVQVVMLEECCRSADRLDELDSIIQGRGVLELMRFRCKDAFSDEFDRNLSVEVKFDNVLGEARQQQNVLKQLLVSLRLPDGAGVKPQRRGARGSYKPTAEKAGNVSSIDRARQRRDSAG